MLPSSFFANRFPNDPQLSTKWMRLDQIGFQLGTESVLVFTEFYRVFLGNKVFFFERRSVPAEPSVRGATGGARTVGPRLWRFSFVLRTFDPQSILRQYLFFLFWIITRTMSLQWNSIHGYRVFQKGRGPLCSWTGFHRVLTRITEFYRVFWSINIESHLVVPDFT